jgi:hypothetical protein
MNIYLRYFNGKASTMEVNVPRRPCVDLSERLKSGQIDAEMFRELESNVVINMMDTLSRFLNDSSYLTYKRSLRVEKEMIEGK